VVCLFHDVNIFHENTYLYIT
jgi:hypothetical protein